MGYRKYRNATGYFEEEIMTFSIKQAPKVSLNSEPGTHIAQAYNSMKHDPKNPAVKEAYGALINETGKQFQDILNSGIKISKIKPGQENPYKTSKDLHSDLERNKHLWFFPTDQGFGPNESGRDHPMLTPTKFKHEGKPLLANDVFRIVHDINGHHIGGKTGFGPKGEHQAYLTHKTMYTPKAQKALATETLMQNSWVNFGPNAEHNRANPHKTIYAEQKAGLAPDSIVHGNWHPGK